MKTDVAVLVELDYCVGCYACQSCCQDYHGLPVDETYLRVNLVKPEYVDGKPVYHMAPVPYNYEKCKQCLDEEGEAPCAKICIGRALHIDTTEKIMQMANELDSRIVIYR